MSTNELSGGARIRYIFQSIFVKNLEEVDPCEDLTDEDIRLAIRNSFGPKSALFVPEVPFEVLVRRQIGHLLDPSLQCAKFIYDELIKMSHRCLASELEQFPVLRKCMDEVICNFLREGLQPAEAMITHIIEMEMDYINTSHPNFIGGNRAEEIAQQQVKCSRLLAAVPKFKDRVDSDKLQPSEKSFKSQALFARASALSGSMTGRSWGISSIFGSSENHASARESSTHKSYSDPTHNMDHSFSMIQLREPPIILRPSENLTEQEAVEIAITKLLLKSYYDIVRKNIEDLVPKALMHFLTLEELPLDAEAAEKGFSLDTDPTGLPKIHGLPPPFYVTNNDFSVSCTASPKNPKSRKSVHSAEQPSTLHSYSHAKGGGYHSGLGSYPSADT